MEYFVGGLPFETTASDLAAYVARFVELNAAMVRTDRDSGRSMGFGGIDVPDGALLDPGYHGQAFGSEKSQSEAREWLDLLNGRMLVVLCYGSAPSYRSPSVEGVRSRAPRTAAGSVARVAHCDGPRGSR